MNYKQVIDNLKHSPPHQKKDNYIESLSVLWKKKLEITWCRIFLLEKLTVAHRRDDYYIREDGKVRISRQGRPLSHKTKPFINPQHVHDVNRT